MTKSLAIGDKAPDFTLPGDGGSEIALAALKGSKVVLYFTQKTIRPAARKKRLPSMAFASLSRRRAP